MKILLFFIATCFFGKTLGQENKLVRFDPEKEYTQYYIDSLRTVMRNSAGQIIELKDYKKILESNENLTGWSYYYFGAAITVGKQRKYDSALFYLNKGISYYERVEGNRKEANIHDLMMLHYYRGDILIELDDYRSAILSHQNALNIAKKKPYKYESVIRHGIASSHYKIGNDSLALEYYLDIAKDSVFMALSKAAVAVNNRIGYLYELKRNYDLAEYFYLNGLARIDETYQEGISTLNGSLGSLYLKRDEFELALIHFKKAYEGYNEFGAGPDVDTLHRTFYRGYIELSQGAQEEGLQDLEELIENIVTAQPKDRNRKRLLMMILKTVVNVYERTGRTNELRALLDKTLLYFEDYQKVFIKEQIQNLEVQYRTKEKDDWIAQLEGKRKEQAIIIKQQKMIGFGLGWIILLIVSSGYLFWRQRKLKVRYEKENLEWRLLRSQMNPHFIGNSMNAISAMVNRKSQDVIPYINELSNLFRMVLNNSREEFVYLKDELSALKSYLELQSKFLKDFDYHFSIDQTIDQSLYIVPPMLIQPIVENAIVHGLKGNDKRGEISIKIKRSNQGLLRCEINDNGVGYDAINLDKKEHKRDSVSGKIIEERLGILRKKFKVNARQEIILQHQGTLVLLYLPYLVDA